MKTSIPASAIGNFTSLEQKRIYDRMSRIMEPVKAAADTFIKCDNGPDDVNSKAGSVLLDGVYRNSSTYSGLCQFDPTTKEIRSLDAHVAHQDLSKVDLDADFVWTCSGRRPGMTYADFKIERASDGSQVYQGPQGTVHVQADGSLFME